ncbi:hypothetical protein SAMN04515647_0749 [Cohaesibacter sp. ES.047]|uniref:hypothetical protein n=1 Tax=Cohaesibacter sp. ES.047 TaxID=1798205 RepID=UPI000BB8CDEB|nr:hypothetical protein [Cohaesibacter sp. ES.047]SNY90579.1 hypothetical protein SAMN04515647_0749 [Cohaesibacter sp. ES.047]
MLARDRTNAEDQALVITKYQKHDDCIAGLVEATAEPDAEKLVRNFVCGQVQAKWNKKTGNLADSMQF